MGNSDRLFADSGGLTSRDVAQLAEDGLVSSEIGSAHRAIHGEVLRHGQAMSFTLDVSQAMPISGGIMVEQVAIAALLMASFIGPICHLIG